MSGSQDREFRRYAQYLAIVFCVPIALALCMLALNLAVDPLWFAAGNRIDTKNFVYNERISKTNLYLQDSARYDCVILGDSRVSLLDARRLDGYRCFNFASAGANLRDIASYADFVRRHTGALKLLVVGVGTFNFSGQELPELTPAFVKNGGDPPGWLSTYLSAEVARFSFRSIWGRSPSPIFYRSDFCADVLRNSSDYDRNPALREQNWRFFMATGPFDTENVPLLQHALAAFPEAVKLGFVPPIAAWFPEELHEAGTLDSYLRVVYGIAPLFDKLWDYSVPSKITRDPGNSYDGQHFYPEINDQIADALLGAEARFGLPLHELTWAEYRRAYTEALESGTNGSR